MKLAASLAIVVALAVAGCGGGGSQSTTAQSTPTPVSISQLEHEAAVQHEMAQNYLRQTMQITRDAYNRGEEYPSNEEHEKAVSLIHLNRKAQQRAAALRGQICERVLQIPNVLPGNGHLAQIAYRCERQGFR